VLQTRESPISTYALSDKKAIGHESPIGPCVATHKVDDCEA
jgi:hypothetical protein